MGEWGRRQDCGQSVPYHLLPHACPHYIAFFIRHHHYHIAIIISSLLLFPPFLTVFNHTHTYTHTLSSHFLACFFFLYPSLIITSEISASFLSLFAQSFFPCLSFSFSHLCLSSFLILSLSLSPSHLSSLHTCLPLSLTRAHSFIPYEKNSKLL